MKTKRIDSLDVENRKIIPEAKRLLNVVRSDVPGQQIRSIIEEANHFFMLSQIAFFSNDNLKKKLRKIFSMGDSSLFSRRSPVWSVKTHSPLGHWYAVS